jgi:hypothetical protein
MQKRDRARNRLAIGVDTYSFTIKIENTEGNKLKQIKSIDRLTYLKLTIVISPLSILKNELVYFSLLI